MSPNGLTATLHCPDTLSKVALTDSKYLWTISTNNTQGLTPVWH
jgi:hypothetical protein